MIACPIQHLTDSVLQDKKDDIQSINQSLLLHDFKAKEAEFMVGAEESREKGNIFYFKHFKKGTSDLDSEM